MPASRRSRNSNVLPIVVALILGVVAGTWVANRSAAGVLAFGLAIGLMVAFLLRQAFAGARPAAPAPVRPSARQPAPGRAPKTPQLPENAKMRRRGWMAPAAPELSSIEVSDECAAGECAICPGPDSGCQCPCGHDSAVIVARNMARADAKSAADDDILPF